MAYLSLRIGFLVQINVPASVSCDHKMYQYKVSPLNSQCVYVLVWNACYACARLNIMCIELVSKVTKSSTSLLKIIVGYPRNEHHKLLSQEQENIQR